MSLSKYANPTEQRIAKALVRYLIGLGYELAVDDGEEITTPITQSTLTLYAAMATTDMDRLHIYVGGQHKGNVLLIWGNDEDLVSDWHSSNSQLDNQLDTFIADLD